MHNVVFIQCKREPVNSSHGQLVTQKPRNELTALFYVTVMSYPYFFYLAYVEV